MFRDFYSWIVTSMPGRTGIFLRHHYYLHRGVRMGKNVKLYEGVRIQGNGDCFLDEGSILYANTIISLGKSGSFRIGKGSHIGAMGYILVGNGTISIGDGSAIGPHTLLIAHSNTYNGIHPIIDNEISGSINVGSDVFIGAGVIVLPNIKISSHSVVGAGAVVTANIDEWVISVGSPAHVIGSRDGKR